MDKTSKVNHGKLFEMLLYEKNISIKRLAELTQLPVPTLYTLKRRKGNRTSPEVLIKISQALNVPIDYWKMTEEDIFITKALGHELTTDKNAGKLDSEVVKTLLEYHKMRPEHIKYALDMIGYNDQITVEEVEKILSGEVGISERLAEDIEMILSKGKKLISREELKIIFQIRNLPAEMRNELLNLLDIFSDADRYRTKILEEWAAAKDNESAT